MNRNMSVMGTIQAASYLWYVRQCTLLYIQKVYMHVSIIYVSDVLLSSNADVKYV